MTYEPSIKFKPLPSRKCLGYTPTGKPCPNIPKSGHFCEICKRKKDAKAPYHYTGEDWSRQEIKARAWTEPYNPDVI